MVLFVPATLRWHRALHNDSTSDGPASWDAPGCVGQCFPAWDHLQGYKHHHLLHDQIVGLVAWAGQPADAARKLFRAHYMHCEHTRGPTRLTITARNGIVACRVQQTQASKTNRAIG
jgi:hypothetical protein